MIHDSWNIAGYDRRAAVRLVKSGINPLLAVLLASRGICRETDIRQLTGTEEAAICDPLLMRDMDRAVARLRTAIEKREHIAIHGDYDVDGLTSVCLLTSYFRARGLKCDTYIPERFEGYGVKPLSLNLLHEKGVTLIVTTDCGITAVEEAAHARALGIDFIITDHHECKDTLPDAVAVVDPKRHDCPYPNKALAGVGVAFKLVCALEGTAQTDMLLDQYGDLVALGTIADVMPVTGENRTFIRRGMRAIQRGGRPGLRKLADASGYSDAQSISVTCVGFALAPRLNAAGRLGKINLALSLLMTDSESEAEQLADALCDMNRTRQHLVDTMFGDAMEMLRLDPPENRPIVIASDKWHQGVAGIVASRLAEYFLLPALVICIEGGSGRGSCRSFGSFNLFSALEQCADLLEHFGGHEMAAGLTVPAENIPELRRRIGEIFQQTSDASKKPALSIDLEVIKPGLLTVENVDALSLLEPYGTGNPTPLLCMQGAIVTAVTPLSGGKHTKFIVRKNRESFECIFFSRAPKDIGAHEGQTVDIAFTPQVNNFRGRRSVQLLLTDVIVCGA